jgi:hypothetical protein
MADSDRDDTERSNEAASPRSGVRTLAWGCLLGLLVGLVVAAILAATAGLEFSSSPGNAPGSRGVLEVEVHICAPGPAVGPSVVRLYSVDAHGVRHSGGQRRGFGPFLWNLPTGNWAVEALGQFRPVIVTTDQLTLEVFGYTGRCSIE